MKHLSPRAPLFFAASALALSSPAANVWPRPADPAQSSSPQASSSQGAQPGLAETLAKEGLLLDLEAGVLAVPASVLIKNELLEYLLVGPSGAMHESLFLTKVRPSMLNAALMLLGVEKGHNARWEDREGPGPENSTGQNGRANRQIYPPEGDGFYLHVAWREAGETYFFRAEDLVRNLASGRSLRRHRWVYLGSHFLVLKAGQPESFLADVEGNLINLSFFFQGNTLLTSAVPECLEQTIWAANEWLLPERGQPVQLFFTRAPLERLKPEWVAGLPEARAPVDAQAGSGAEEDEEK